MSGHGPFVYTGSGRKVSADADVTLRACRDEACAIQWCLAKRNHQEARCTDAISRWRLCCEAALQRERESQATSAPSPSLAKIGVQPIRGA